MGTRTIKSLDSDIADWLTVCWSVFWAAVLSTLITYSLYKPVCKNDVNFLFFLDVNLFLSRSFLVPFSFLP